MEWVVEPDKKEIEPEFCILYGCGAKGCVIDCIINFL